MASCIRYFLQSYGLPPDSVLGRSARFALHDSSFVRYLASPSARLRRPPLASKWMPPLPPPPRAPTRRRRLVRSLEKLRLAGQGCRRYWIDGCSFLGDSAVFLGRDDLAGRNHVGVHGIVLHSMIIVMYQTPCIPCLFMSLPGTYAFLVSCLAATAGHLGRFLGASWCRALRAGGPKGDLFWGPLWPPVT